MRRDLRRRLEEHLQFNLLRSVSFQPSNFDAWEESDGRRLNSRRPTVSRGGATCVNVYTFSQAPASSIDPPASGLGVSDAPASIQIVPGLEGPTILDIAGNSGYVALHAVIDSRDTFHTILELKKIGAKGILTTAIERLVN